MKIKVLPDTLKEMYSYDASTGVVRRTVSMGNYKSGTECKSMSTNKKYYKTTYNGMQLMLHRLVWFLYYGEQPPEVIDHINGNGLDNRISNLRAATTSTNQMNIDVTSKSTTGIKGIMPVRGGKLYRAEVCVDGKRHQKHSKDINKLVQWVEAKRLELHGQYAR